MKQCDAKTLSSSYSPTHRCLKSSGLKKIGRALLCGHHRAMAERRGAAGGR